CHSSCLHLFRPSAATLTGEPPGIISPDLDHVANLRDATEVQIEWDLDAYFDHAEPRRPNLPAGDFRNCPRHEAESDSPNSGPFRERLERRWSANAMPAMLSANPAQISSTARSVASKDVARSTAPAPSASNPLGSTRTASMFTALELPAYCSVPAQTGVARAARSHSESSFWRLISQNSRRTFFDMVDLPHGFNGMVPGVQFSHGGVRFGFKTLSIGPQFDLNLLGSSTAGRSHANVLQDP